MLKSKFETFANTFLQTNIALLAANDDDIVITIRIPREKLALNHSILSVLSDYASGVDIQPPPAPTG